MSKGDQRKVIEKPHQEFLPNKQSRWLELNRAALEAYNRRVESRGAFSDGLRTF